MNRTLGAVLSVLIGIAVFGLFPAESGAANHTITVDDFLFAPAKKHVQVNDSVIWIWAGSFSHSTTSDAGSGKTWNSGLKTSGRFGIKITAADGAGPFPYHCSLHLSMKDTIFVDPPPACCPNLTGNIDCDAGQGVDISDLSRLIDNLYISFSPLCCDKAANTDGQLGVDISDLTRLIDFLYISFSPLAACQ
jgi:plastocyanin